MTGFTAEGQEAYAILDWTDEDQRTRLPVALARVRELAAPLVGQDSAFARRALAEVQDVGQVLTRLSDAYRVTDMAEDSSITAQVIGLAGWRTAWMHEPRDSKGRWTHGIASQAMKAEQQAKSDFQETGRELKAAATPMSGRLISKRVAAVNKAHAARLADIASRRQQTPGFSPDVEHFLNPEKLGDAPAPGIARQALGPSLPKTGLPAIDQRMVVAHAQNAVRKIQQAKDLGQLNDADAKKVTDAVNSLAKSSLAANRQIEEMRQQMADRDDRLDRLERAMQEQHARLVANERNDQLRQEANRSRDERDEAVEEAHATAARVRSTVMGVGSSLANAAMTLGAFFMINDALPKDPHEWMIAAIPLATAVAQGMWLPLYEAHKERQLEKSVAKAKNGIPVNGVTAEFANSSQIAGAMQFLLRVFTMAGAPQDQAQQLAGWLLDDNRATA